MQISSIVHDKILAENSSELQPARQIPCQSCKTMASGRTLFFPFSSALTSCSVLLGKQLGCPCFVGVDTPPPPLSPTPTYGQMSHRKYFTHTNLKFVTSSSLGKLKKAVSYILKSCPGILAVRVPSQAATESSSQAAGVPHKLLECLTGC